MATQALPVLSLPPEIITMMCEHLSGADLSSFRLTCRAHADIGARRHFREVHVMFRPKSFDNLLAISTHPFFSRCVTKVFYEAHMMETPISRVEWKRHIPMPEGSKPNSAILSGLPRPPKPGASEREQRLYKREVQRQLDMMKPENAYTQAQLKKAWNAYIKMWEESWQLEEEDVDIKTIKRALTRFPNLKEVVMSTLNNTKLYPMSEAIKNAYLPALCVPGTVSNSSPELEDKYMLGVRHLSSLLSGAASANLKLETLRCDHFSWTVFDPQPPRVILHPLFLTLVEYPILLPEPKAFVSAFKFMKRIVLDIAPGCDFDMHVELKPSACQGQLGACLKAAQNLEHLELTFGECVLAGDFRMDTEAVEFSKVFGTSTWPKLKTLHLKVMDIKQDSFVAFFARHSSLQTILLKDLSLLSGDWGETFRDLHPHFSQPSSGTSSLPGILFYGTFGLGDWDQGVPEMLLPMETPGMQSAIRYPASSWRRRMGMKSLGELLAMYYQGKVECPLRTVAEAGGELETLAASGVIPRFLWRGEVPVGSVGPEGGDGVLSPFEDLPVGSVAQAAVQA